MSVHSSISAWLPALLSQEHERAWDGFLKEYAALILQVVYLFERDQDRIDDCFVFVCEQLKRDDLKRIRRFDTDGSASFSTWLRAVVRNLCLDWRRKRFGRPRLYRSIARLPATGARDLSLHPSSQAERERDLPHRQGAAPQSHAGPVGRLPDPYRSGPQPPPVVALDHQSPQVGVALQPVGRSRPPRQGA